MCVNPTGDRRIIYHLSGSHAWCADGDLPDLGLLEIVAGAEPGTHPTGPYIIGTRGLSLILHDPDDEYVSRAGMAAAANALDIWVWGEHPQDPHREPPPERRKVWDEQEARHAYLCGQDAPPERFAEALKHTIRAARAVS